MNEEMVGIGVDLCAWERVPEFNREHPFFRFLSEEEVLFCLSRPDPRPSLAARFAAREALLKALNGFAPWMNEIKIIIDESGAPSFTGSIPDDVVLHLSLAHDAGIAVAIVIVERKAVDAQ